MVNSITKRLLAVGVASTMLGVGLVGCSNDAGNDGKPGDGPRSLVYVGNGGLTQEEIMKWVAQPWADENKVDLLDTTPVDYAKYETMVKQGQTVWDVVQVPTGFSLRDCGVLHEKIDLSGIDMSQFPEGTVHECGAPQFMFSTVMVYNTETYGNNPPTTQADFFDTKKFPGVRAIPKSLGSFPMEAALLADGVKAKDMYPLDVDRALAKYDSLGDSLEFWGLGAEQVEAMDSKRWDMALVWSGRAVDSINRGAPYKPIWENSVYSFGMLTIPKGAPNVEAARDFITYSLQADTQATFAEHVPYSPVNMAAKPKLEGLFQEFNVSRPEIQAVAFVPDSVWWSKNEVEMLDLWSKWMLG